MLVTTTELMPGYRVDRVLGPVVGIAVRSRSPYVEGLKSVRDGHSVNPEYRRELMTQFRLEAVQHMLAEAKRAGANAVVGMRFDHRAVTESWNEICAYGTAVVVVTAENNAPKPRAAPVAGSVS